MTTPGHTLDALIAALFGLGDKLFCCAVGAATLAAMVPHLFDMWKVM